MERRFELDDRPLSLRWTLRLMTMWGASTWLKLDDSGAWFARRTPDGPGTVHLRHGGDHLLARAYGPGAAFLIDGVPDLVGLSDPGVEIITPHHDFVADAQRRLRGTRQGRTGEVYPRLIAAALAQKVTGKQSKAALRMMAWRWGEAAPGPREDLRLLPDPRKLAGKPYTAFRQFGVERHRADLLRRIAQRATALERAASMPHGQARAHLEKLRGIGPWTSGVVASGSLGDPDAVPIGDYHLPNMVAWNLAGEPRATDERMMELLAPYEPHRGRVARLVKGAGKKAPKYGPRNRIYDIREW